MKRRFLFAAISCAVVMSVSAAAVTAGAVSVADKSSDAVVDLQNSELVSVSNDYSHALEEDGTVHITYYKGSSTEIGRAHV